jgi:hypothetical protein
MKLMYCNSSLHLMYYLTDVTSKVGSSGTSRVHGVAGNVYENQRFFSVVLPARNYARDSDRVIVGDDRFGANAARRLACQSPSIRFNADYPSSRGVRFCSLTARDTAWEFSLTLVQGTQGAGRSSFICNILDG